MNADLTSFTLSQIPIGDTGAAALAETSNANTSLTSLTIGRNGIGETGAAAPAIALETLAKQLSRKP